MVDDIGTSDHAYASIWADNRFYVAGGSLLATGWTGIIVAYTARANDEDHPSYQTNVTEALNSLVDVSQKLRVSVQPNPSVLSFRLQLHSNETNNVTINVLDNSGRTVETRTGVPANSSFELGQHYIPGVYYVQVIQGKEKIMLKLLKTPG